MSSAVWAAWGDAVGFPSELVDGSRLEARTGVTRLRSTRPWHRRVGGAFGPEVDFPPGAYSDDTQLRLAVARAIGPDGRFDVEGFSKVELPVFLSYGLGVGRGTKAACRSLTKTSAKWSSNFFEERGASYIDGGGNGAAMRIQPHIWCAMSRWDFDSWAIDVVRNSVVTHGHPRGFVGALFHAALLALAIEDRKVPEPSRWLDIVDWLATVSKLIARDDELAELWMPTWERATGTALDRAFATTASEVRNLIEQLENQSQTLDDSTWRDAVRVLGGMDPKTRGSGTISAVLAGWLAFLGQDRPESSLLIAANLLGSDTDTIATMAGAILGAVRYEARPQSPIQDVEFIEKTASWLDSVSKGTGKGRFRYPDLLEWSPPRSGLDYVGTVDGHPALAGLGRFRPSGSSYGGGHSKDEIWEWVTLDFGQTLLVKRRREVRELPSQLRPRSRLSAGADEGVEPPRPATLFYVDEIGSERNSVSETRSKDLKEIRVNEDDKPGSSVRQALPTPLTFEVAMNLVIGSGFPEDLIGECVRSFALQEDGVIKAAAFAAAVAEHLSDRYSSDIHHQNP